ncbi:MAG: hypothetical protein KatS3mg056_3717 [Chloroflexus sp.]|nr:MAG: hypothetical protein KatS3mg056_3717 [Chloroflexus sp.]
MLWQVADKRHGTPSTVTNNLYLLRASSLPVADKRHGTPSTVTLTLCP